MAKKIVCGSCGAKFKDTLPKCPYCGTLNYKGAETEYLGKLEHVRSDMELLGNVPEEETRKELRGQVHFVRKILLAIMIVVTVCGVYLFWANREEKRNLQEDYVWQQENFPVMEEWYQQGKYDELLEFYHNAVMEDRPLIGWKHDDFCNMLYTFSEVDELLDQEEAGEALQEYQYTGLLYDCWKAEGLSLRTTLTDEEKEILEPYAERARKDLATRWQFTEEERLVFEQELRKYNGFVTYDTCKQYVKQWMKGRTNREM